MTAVETNELQLRNRVTLHLVAPLTFLVFLNSLDRVNVSFAALRMNADLGIDAHSYSFGVGIFFFAYLLFQFPHTFVLRRIGFDPASASAPFVATLVDVTALSIYFYVAVFFLRGTLL